ncbi:MAG TPA: TIGR03936 family radical SAM-associated protein [Armatimonadota bacterium]|jgi:radical SAM-linked protein
MLKLRKGEAVKYLSHRDVIRAFEMALRRAKVPIAFSEGFNPRPKMSFGNAIGVGVTSEDERIQLDIAVPCEPAEIMDMLNIKLPPGIQVTEAEFVQEGVKSPISRLNASEYLFTAAKDGCTLDAVQAALAAMLASGEIRVIREKEGSRKEIDIRQYLLDASAVESEDGSIVMDISLGSGDTGGAGTRDFVKAITKLLPEIQVTSICRKRQFQNL